MQGVIIKGIGGFYYVRTDSGSVYECRARGIFRKENIKPMIGDNVELSVIDSNHGNIDTILPRKTQLVRPPVANIDTLVIVAAAKDPNPDYYLIDKLLLMAEMNKITPVICINKTDLETSDEIRQVYKYTGYRIFEACAKSDTLPPDLIEFIKNKTTAFAGLSGVGKSSLLNLLIDSDVEIGAVSSKIGRGRHTTRHIELFELKNGGYVLDTPGFSSYEPDIIEASELCEYFPEMAGLSSQCRFKGCAHINEPDCAIKTALKNGQISPERYLSYSKMYDILKNFKKW